MSLIFMDGIELGGLGLWSEISGAAAAGSPPSGFTGSYYLSVGYNCYARKTFAASKSTLYFAFR